MSLQRRMVLLPLLLLITRATEERNRRIQMKGTNFLQKLDEDLKLCKKHRETENLDAYTVFQITGKEYEIGDFDRVYQSIFGKRNQDDMVSIITLRSYFAYEPYNAEGFLHKFTEALQECISENKRHVLLDNIGLTIDYVKQAHFDDFNVLSTTANRVANIHKEFVLLTLDYIPELCFAALKDITVYWFRGRLKNIEVYNEILCHYNQGTLENYHKDMLELFTKWLDDIATFDCILKYVSFESRGEGTVFNDLYLKICDLEDKQKFEHFKHNKNDLNNFLLSLANVWYRELFRDCLRNVIQQYQSILTNEGVKEVFAKLSKLVCDNAIEYIAQRPSMGYGNFLGYMDRFFKGADVLQFFQDFYEPLRSQEIHDALRKTYKPVTDDMKMEILSEKITQIIIREKMNIEGAAQLNKIIRGAGLFERQQKCQFVHIDKGRVISEIETPKFTAICDAMVFDSVPNGRIELFSASKTTTEHAKCQRLKTFTYSRILSDTSLMSSVSNDEIFTKSHETTITLENRDERGWDIADSTHCFLRNMCIVNNKSSIINTFEITVNNESGSSFIIVIIQKAIEYSGEIVSLIYDMPVADQKKNGSDAGNLRCIKCHNNVPILFLDCLRNCLLLSLTSDTVLNCPNLFVMSNFDIIYSEHIITNGCPSELTSQDLTTITQWYDCEGCHYAGRRPRVTIGQILESKDENIFNIKILEKSIEKLGISMAEYNDGIRAFLLNKGVINVTDLEPSASKHQLSREINIFATKHHDGTLVTHFCVIMKNCYLHSLTVNRIKDLSPIMELKESVTTLKTLECLMQFTKSKTSFITSVLDDICKVARYSKQPNNDYYVNMGEKGCKTAINKHIDHLFASLAAVVENSISRSSLPADFNLPAYRESIKLEEIDLIAKTISENLHLKPHNAMIKIYFLKIKKSKDHCKRGLCSENLVGVEEQYEDVSYFREGISWYPIK